MNRLKVFVTLERMKHARRELGNVGALNEGLVATGIDAWFHLMDGGELEMDGKRLRLVVVDDS